MRWSPRECDRAAAQAAGAAHDEAVVGRLGVAAERVQRLDDAGDAVGLLHAQLLRAGDDGLALGEAAEQADERQLVDRQRHLVRLDDRARRARPRATSRSLIGSAVGTRRRRARCSRSPSTIAPIRWAIVMKPVRVWLTPQPWITRREPFTRTPAAIANAADDGSAGTVSTLGQRQLVDARDA